MATDSVPGASSPTNGPAPSPETPITIRVDGSIPAVDFVKRLHRGGMELRNATDGGYAILSLADDQAPQPVSGLRRRLFEASGIVHCVRVALDGTADYDEAQLASALEAAGRLIDNVAGKLEGISDV